MNTHYINRSILFAILLTLAANLSVPMAPTAVAQAGTRVFRVAPAGANSSSCGSETAPCRTIQYAVSLAAEGDTILVAGGTYVYDAEGDQCAGSLLSGTAVVCFFDRTLTILGGFSPSNWVMPDSVANVTIIDGQHARRAVSVARTRLDLTGGLRIEGFTIRNGLVQGPANSPDSKVFGGGLLSENASLVIRDMIFADNQAIGGTDSVGGVGAGGGLAFNAAANFPGTSGELLRVTFANNQARGGFGSVRGGVAQGGALFTYGVTLNGASVRFTGNSAVGGDDTGSLVGGQRADGLGGAAAFQLRSVVSLQDVTAANNWAAGGTSPAGDGGGAWGGAFFVEGAGLMVQGASFTGNLAQGGAGQNPTSNGSSIAQGGALASIGGWEGSLPIDTNITLDRASFVNNVSRSGSGGTSGYTGASGGGAMALTYSHGTHYIVNSIFADNIVDIGTGQWVGGGGGALWFQGVVANIVHSTLARNQLTTALQDKGAQGLALLTASPWPDTWTTSVSISYLIIADHTSSKPRNHTSGLAAVQCSPNTALTLNRGLWAGNTLNDNSGDGASWRCDIQGLSTMLNASTAGFVSAGPPNYNYHLLMSSPARDQATGSNTTVDIDGGPRSTPDIGADEWVPFPLSAAPGEGAILLTWRPNAGLNAVVNDYNVIVSCPAGAAPPGQGACGVPINAGTGTSFALTGLTNGKEYTIEVRARSATGAELSRSAPASATPFLATSHVYLPLAIRVSGG